MRQGIAFGPGRPGQGDSCYPGRVLPCTTVYHRTLLLMAPAIQRALQGALQLLRHFCHRGCPEVGSVILGRLSNFRGRPLNGCVPVVILEIRSPFRCDGEGCRICWTLRRQLGVGGKLREGCRANPLGRVCWRAGLLFRGAMCPR